MYGTLRQSGQMPYRAVPQLLFGMSGRSLVLTYPVTLWSDEGVSPTNTDQWCEVMTESAWSNLHKSGVHCELRKDDCCWIPAGWVSIVFTMNIGPEPAVLLMQPVCATLLLEGPLKPSLFRWVVESVSYTSSSPG